MRELKEEQAKAFEEIRKFIETGTGMHLLTGAAGCLSGETLLSFNRGTRHSGRISTIKRAYHLFNNIYLFGKGNNDWDRNKATNTLSLQGIEIKYNNVEAIVYSGVQQTYKVTTQSGRFICVTSEHPFRRPPTSLHQDEEGFTKLSNLVVGDKILLRSRESGKGRDWSKRIKRKTIYEIIYHPYKHKNISFGKDYGRLPYAVLVYEANMNHIAVKDYIHELKTNPDCKNKYIFLSPELVIHHLDENPLNDDLTNLVAITKKEHDTLHGYKNSTNKRYSTAIEEEIINIEKYKIEDTYDIIMKAPYHNYVANDFIVHNTGKTYTLGEVVSYALMQHISVLVTAPTNKAVKVLKKIVNEKVEYSTIHSALGMKEYIDPHGVLSFKNDPKAKHWADNYKLIIVDEASMLDDTIFQELVNLSNQYHKILFVGDPFQIPPVNHIHAKPFIRSVQAQYNIEVSTLNEIVRQAQDSPVIVYATSIRSDIHKPVQIFNSQTLQQGNSSVFMVPRAKKTIFIDDILPLFQSVEYQNDIDYVKVIAWRNITVDTYNRLIRMHILGEDLPKIIPGDRLILEAPITEDRKTIISTNEECEVISTTIEQEVLSDLYTLKYYKARVKVFSNEVFNEYMIKIMHEDSEKDFEKLLYMQKNLAKSYPVGSFQSRSAWIDYYQFLNTWAHVKYSYCITGHRSQGSTYHTAYVLAWDILINQNVLEHNRILYTASTRPSTNLYIEY